jgi:hypothetical protein
LSVFGNLLVGPAPRDGLKPASPTLILACIGSCNSYRKQRIIPQPSPWVHYPGVIGKVAGDKEGPAGAQGTHAPEGQDGKLVPIEALLKFKFIACKRMVSTFK